jgi:hypothetical protein
MKYAVAAIALIVVANGAVLVSVRRERLAPATLATIDVCPDQLIGGGSSDEPPALRLTLALDSLPTPPGLEAAGLRALGFSEAATAAVGRQRDSTFRWPRARPAWLRLRSREDSPGQLAVAEVAPRRELLARDSGSIVIRGLIGLRERWNGPPPNAGAGHEHSAEGRPRTSGVIYPAVTELIPYRLHLDKRQVEALREAFSGAVGCGVRKRAVIGNGADGGIWVESVR